MFRADDRTAVFIIFRFGAGELVGFRAFHGFTGFIAGAAFFVLNDISTFRYVFRLKSNTGGGLIAFVFISARGIANRVGVSDTQRRIIPCIFF